MFFLTLVDFEALGFTSTGMDSRCHQKHLTVVAKGDPITVTQGHVGIFPLSIIKIMISKLHVVFMCVVFD